MAKFKFKFKPKAKSKSKFTGTTGDQQSIPIKSTSEQKEVLVDGPPQKPKKKSKSNDATRVELTEEIAMLHQQITSLQSHTTYTTPKMALSTTDVIEEFCRLKRDIEYLCCNMAAAVQQHKLQNNASVYAGIYHYPSVKEFKFRNILSRLICTSVFDPFHPMLVLKDTANKELLEVFSLIREHGQQQLSIRWREITFIVLQNLPIDEWKKHVLGDIESRLGHRYNKDLLDDICGQFWPILLQAYAWNFKVKTSITPFEFRPVVEIRDIGVDAVTDVTGSDIESDLSLYLVVGLGLQSTGKTISNQAVTTSWLENVDVVKLN